MYSYELYNLKTKMNIYEQAERDCQNAINLCRMINAALTRFEKSSKKIIKETKEEIKEEPKKELK